MALHYVSIKELFSLCILSIKQLLVKLIAIYNFHTIAAKRQKISMLFDVNFSVWHQFQQICSITSIRHLIATL